MILAAASHLNERTDRLVASTMGVFGHHPGIIAYGGLGSRREARVLGRVLMTRTSDQRQWLREHRGFRQFLDAQVPRQPVRVTLGAAETVVRADFDGYIDVTLPGHGLPAGWHDATFQVLHAGDVAHLTGRAHARGASRKPDAHPAAPAPAAHDGATRPAADPSSSIPIPLRAGASHRIRAGIPVTIPVRIVGDHETSGVVSDIDDTVMVSMVPRLLQAAKLFLVDHVRNRQAVPGMADLLVRLGHRDTGGAYMAPILYLSSNAWNSVPALRDFLGRMRYPQGAFAMTDFGITPTTWFRSGRTHKRQHLAWLHALLPQVSWYLVGDDGEHDPEIYADFAAGHPDAVRGIAIRSLTPLEQVVGHGSPRPGRTGALDGVPAGIPVWVGGDGNALLAAIDEDASGRG